MLLWIVKASDEEHHDRREPTPQLGTWRFSASWLKAIPRRSEGLDETDSGQFELPQTALPLAVPQQGCGRPS